MDHSFQNCLTFSESVEPLLRNCYPNMTQNERVYTICCRPEVAGDVLSGANVKSIEGYALLTYEFANSSNFRDIKKNYFVTAQVADIDDIIK